MKGAYEKITLGGMQASILYFLMYADQRYGCVPGAGAFWKQLSKRGSTISITQILRPRGFRGGFSQRPWAKSPRCGSGFISSPDAASGMGGLFRYDFSKSHILKSVDGILKRLNTDYLDALLLHRPDPLVEPEEVAEAFELLHSSGKVRSFGVSNQSPMLIELLQKYVNQPLVINQLQFGVAHTPMLDQELFFNMTADQSVDRSSEILEYCRLKDIAIQAWSPFQYGFLRACIWITPNLAR